MYTSADRPLLKYCLGYTAAAALAALFGAVYEHFSHEVYSYFMIYAFLIPLLAGALPLLCIMLFFKGGPCPLALRLYSFAIAALTAGSIFQGVLEIYGTTNRLIIVYPIAGALMLIAALLAGLLKLR